MEATVTPEIGQKKMTRPPPPKVKMNKKKQTKPQTKPTTKTTTTKLKLATNILKDVGNIGVGQGGGLLSPK